MTPPVYTDSPLELLSTAAYESGETDPFTIEASHMALTHNSFIRGYNSIYQQAPRVGAADAKDFIAYCLAWRTCVYEHHHHQETEYFPAIDEATHEEGIMHEEIKAHETFRIGLDNFRNYLESYATQESEFDPVELLRIMDEFGHPLHRHLASEPNSILALAQLSTMDHPIDIEKIAREVGRKQTTLGFAFNTLPIFLLNMETVEFEEGMWHGVFPPLHSTVKYVLYSWVPMWRGSQWRFATCDANGARKPLAV